MCIPQKLKPYFSLLDLKSTGNTVVHGQMICCSESRFDVLYWGSIKKDLFGHSTLNEVQNGLIIILRCKKCGRKIELFNSFTDGYDRCINEQEKMDDINFQQLTCNANGHSDFSADVTFEYFPQEELIEDGFLRLIMPFHGYG